jgi:hypothetical protein
MLIFPKKAYQRASRGILANILKKRPAAEEKICGQGVFQNLISERIGAFPSFCGSVSRLSNLLPVTAGFADVS